MKFKTFFFVALIWLACPLESAFALDGPDFTRREDVVYGRKFGVALTLDVITPKEKPNGLGIISIMSGGWVSSHDWIGPQTAGFAPYLDRGYTIFAVVHGCQPKFTIPEILKDMPRAVRFIRFNAREYHIDPDHIGITGGSAGGHLSLMQGTAGDDGDPNAKDEVEGGSRRVQAVACFFPPTDFLNYGKPGEIAIGRNILSAFAAPFDFHEFDSKLHKYMPVADEKKYMAIGRYISPVNHVSGKAPPTLIMHGNKDKLVPIQQSELMIEKLKAAGVEAKLIVKPDAEHGWKDMTKDAVQFADWFDAHLKKKEAPKDVPAETK